MSGNASIDLAWGDGDYTFRLAIGQLRELQEKTNSGPVEIIDRLGSARWRIDDIRETIRLGLIGGGVQPIKALALVKTYVDDRPFGESLETATRILAAALVGVPDDPAGKAEAKETASAVSSPSPASSEPLAQSESVSAN